MRDTLRQILSTWKTLFGSLIKWMFLSILIGAIIGGIASAFAYVVTWATQFRIEHPMVILGLPAGGLVIVFLYKIMGQEQNTGTNMVLSLIHI